MALESRRRGLPIRSIAEDLGVDEATVRDAIALALAEVPMHTDAEQERALSFSRIDAMLQGVWLKAIDGEVDAIDRVLKLEDLRARLLGEPDRIRDGITQAVEASIAALELEPADEALTASVRQLARQIDHAVAFGSSIEATKAMYLLPHLWNGLGKLGATPESREELSKRAGGTDGKGNDKRQKLQALRTAAQAARR
ncbi:hypothetical protein A9Z40_03085 [Microbacterium arborescens]|uniref:Terminase small subunit actinomycetes phage-type domain-containing protein n=1 Tax=Microbacterium arborescens TaxID=33883 RepID=A0ABX2WJH0_9MICO|nr:hypothetical protein [Microbacterium arborescens]OAZ40940.1 hypothetical protein A9Z40_03085 [Microbacterium arborescens]